MSEKLVTPRGDILLWQGVPPAREGKTVLTAAAKYKWYSSDVVIVEPLGNVLLVTSVISDEESCDIWSWSHAPNPFFMIALAHRREWAVDPAFAKCLFDNYYMYTEEIMSLDEPPRIGPFVGVDTAAIRVLAK